MLHKKKENKLDALGYLLIQSKRLVKDSNRETTLPKKSVNIFLSQCHDIFIG